MEYLLLIGAGGVGSWIVEFLLRSNINVSIRVADGDEVEEKNLLYTAYREEDVGKNKAKVLEDRYSGKVVAYTNYINNELELKSLLITESLVIVATDNLKTRKMVYENCDKWIDVRATDSDYQIFTYKSSIAKHFVNDNAERGSCQTDYNRIRYGNIVCSASACEIIQNILNNKPFPPHIFGSVTGNVLVDLGDGKAKNNGNESILSKAKIESAKLIFEEEFQPLIYYKQKIRKMKTVRIVQKWNIYDDICTLDYFKVYPIEDNVSEFHPNVSSDTYNLCTGNNHTTSCRLSRLENTVLKNFDIAKAVLNRADASRGYNRMDSIEKYLVTSIPNPSNSTNRNVSGIERLRRNILVAVGRESDSSRIVTFNANRPRDIDSSVYQRVSNYLLSDLEQNAYGASDNGYRIRGNRLRQWVLYALIDIEQRMNLPISQQTLIQEITRFLRVHDIRVSEDTIFYKVLEFARETPPVIERARIGREIEIISINNPINRLYGEVYDEISDDEEELSITTTTPHSTRLRGRELTLAILDALEEQLLEEHIMSMAGLINNIQRRLELRGITVSRDSIYGRIIEFANEENPIIERWRRRGTNRIWVRRIGTQSAIQDLRLRLANRRS
jgi:predicted nucleotidyltransferase